MGGGKVVVDFESTDDEQHGLLNVMNVICELAKWMQDVLFYTCRFPMNLIEALPSKKLPHNTTAKSCCSGEKQDLHALTRYIMMFFPRF